MKPYRSIIFNEERKWKSHHKEDDIIQVGKLKAVGYSRFESSEIDELKRYKKEFIENGKLTKTKIEAIKYHYLYVGDLKMIQSILDQHKDYLLKVQYPIDAKNFFNTINIMVDHDKDFRLYHIICELFNSWCLFCERPALATDGSGFTGFSIRPYDPDLVDK